MISELYALLYRHITEAALIVASPQHVERIWFTLMLAGSHTVPVMLFEFFLLIIGYFHIFDECLIQKRPTDPVLGRKCWINAILNHFVVMPLVLGLVAYPCFIYFTDVSSLELPPTRTVITHIFVCILIEDFLFYWSHRILHHPSLYKYFHKKHHEFKVLSGYAIASEYTHPVESLVGNIIPVMMGPLVTRSHFFTSCTWLVIRMLKTCDAHSGYAFQWSPFGLFYPLNPAERHDFHHETGLGSYGSFFLLWDQWTGTDEQFLQSRKKGGRAMAVDSKGTVSAGNKKKKL